MTGIVQTEAVESSNGSPAAGSALVSLHAPLPEYVETGRGQFLVVSGDCTAPGRRIRGIEIVFNGLRTEAELSEIPDGVGFWQAVLLTQDLSGTSAPLEISVRFASGETLAHDAGEVRCRDVDWQPADMPGGLHGRGVVAICMATYSPDFAAFARQTDSIRSQSCRHWICIVNDDGTPEGQWQKMQEHCAGDGRFLFFRNPRNLGFYGNFEQALKRVPRDADYVALADQDDQWYPYKLERLLEKLESSDASLVYSDMRIVDAQGQEIAPTYWVNRRNEYRDLQAVLVANTVTGAASLFRRGILEDLVPFPPRVGDAFHDHWLACVTMSTGTLAYIDAPLYDYYQYGTSVIGHCDFVRFSLWQRIASLLRFIVRLCRPATARPLLLRKYGSALAIYRGECRRLRLVEGTIRRRCRLSSRRRRQLGNFNGGVGSLLRLLMLHARVLIRGQTTDDAELRLAMGELARLVEKRRIKGRK
ncbi:MAG: glycosyltransferase [Arenicellales bacterium]